MIASTSLGDVPVGGRFSTDPARAVLFVVQGLFSRPEALGWLSDALPAVDVALVRLPGFQTPALLSPGMEAAGAAYADVVAQLFHGRHVVTVGVSAGALPALSMGAERLVLVEPFLQPGKIWALRALLRQMGVDRDARMRAWVDAMLGLFTDPGRDYSPLLAHLAGSTDVLVGDEPLEPVRGDLGRFPSLTSDAERQVWQAARGVRLHVCNNAGHNVPDEARQALVDVLEVATARPTLVA